MGLLRQLGDFYTRLERHDEACAAHEDELLLREKAQGMQHFRTWGTMWTLGQAYERAGRHEEEAANYRELLSILPASPDDAVEQCREMLLECASQS